MMEDNEYEFTLFDRLEKIKAINEQYDLEHNAYLSFSGGKDSTVLSHLIDKALPNNKIPRVFIDTGVEYNAIREFALENAKNDERFVILKPTKNVKKILEEKGYPFKSKQHSHNISIYQNNSESIDEMMKKIELDHSLLKDLKFFDTLPKGTSSVVRYITGIRDKEVGGGENYIRVCIVSLTPYYITLQMVSI